MNELLEWSLKAWRNRHENGYFPRSEQHKNWKVYEELPDWLMQYAQPKPDDICVEIGCGYGEWMIPLSAHVAHITGFDIHTAPLVKGVQFAEERNLGDKLAFCIGSGQRIPHTANQFSLVYSISVFQHLPRAIVQNYLQETLRVLKPGGRCLHHFRNADNVGPFPTPAKDIGINHKGDFSCGWTAAEVHAAGEEAGLRAVQVIDIGLFLLMYGEK